MRNNEPTIVTQIGSKVDTEHSSPKDLKIDCHIAIIGIFFFLRIIVKIFMKDMKATGDENIERNANKQETIVEKEQTEVFSSFE